MKFAFICERRRATYGMAMHHHAPYVEAVFVLQPRLRGLKSNIGVLPRGELE